MPPRCFICRVVRSHQIPLFTCPDMGSDHTAWSQALPNFQHKLSTKPLICGRHFHHGSVVAVRAGSHINFALLAKALPSESIVTEEDKAVSCELLMDRGEDHEYCADLPLPPVFPPSTSTPASVSSISNLLYDSRTTLDSSYKPSDAESDETMSNKSIPLMNEFGNSTAYIVFYDQLQELLMQRRCPVCVGPMVATPREVGSALVVSYRCPSCGGSSHWESQPRVGGRSGKFAGNVLSVTCTFLNGSTYGVTNSFMKCFGIANISSETFYRFQSQFVIPSINRLYEEQEQAILSDMKRRDKPVILTGDGRFDSPGHSARYCHYLLIDYETGKVCKSVVVQSAVVGSAVTAEKAGFIQGLEEVLNEGIIVECIATDGHTGIASYLKKEHSLINHQLDVWHVAKNFIKRLTNECTTNEKKKLLPWLKHIKNHLWYVASHCGGDIQLLVDMFDSVKFHLTNTHDFEGCYDTIARCLHEPYDKEEQQDRQWLHKGSEAHKVLVKNLERDGFTKSLRKLERSIHTGSLENINSVTNKYAPKRLDFELPSFQGRVRLAVMDHNENVGRPVLLDENNQEKVKGYWSKMSKEWRCAAKYAKKTQEFRDVVKAAVLQASVAPTVKKRPDTQSAHPTRVPKPSNQELKDRHITRLTKK